MFYGRVYPLIYYLPITGRTYDNLLRPGFKRHYFSKPESYFRCFLALPGRIFKAHRGWKNKPFGIRPPPPTAFAIVTRAIVSEIIAATSGRRSTGSPSVSKTRGKIFFSFPKKCPRTVCEHVRVKKRFPNLHAKLNKPAAFQTNGPRVDDYYCYYYY